MLQACVDAACMDVNSRDPVTLDTEKLGTTVSVPVGQSSDGILAIGVRGANNADRLYRDGIQISAVSNGSGNQYVQNCKGRWDVEPTISSRESTKTIQSNHKRIGRLR